ncbi:XdhC family protein [Streptomyces sp. NPDC127072]|uniref:XdhC family protein n=1 Tax=Streptomyces sp. NPDC127072 TaxID=3347129 RepID=UPI003664587D
MSRPAALLEARIAELTGRHEPFVKATVVRARRPASARPGDIALVLADGRIEGFIGGVCAEATVRVQALRTLLSGEALLLRISPDVTAGGGGEPVAEDGAMRVANPCLSGGELEIFLEPLRPPPRVVVTGDSPIAGALSAFGPALGYEITTAAADRTTPEALAGVQAVVIASHGRDEETVLVSAARAGVPYVGLVAGPRRGAAVLAGLDLDEERLARIHTPAGLWIGARTPGEIAVSILAEIIRVVGGDAAPGGPVATAAPVAAAGSMAVPDSSTIPDFGTVQDFGTVSDPSTVPDLATVTDFAGGTTAHSPRPTTATDLVCGMTVAVVDGTPYSDAGDGGRRWFCRAGCRTAYEKDPARYPEADVS